MKGIFEWLVRGRRRQVAVAAWQAALVRTARDFELYQAGLVPDTFEGRQNMLGLVTVLAMRRFRSANLRDKKLPQAVYHGVFQTLDDGLREEGVGDSSIARKIRKMGEGFVGLARSLDAAFDAEDDAEIAACLTRNQVSLKPECQDLIRWLRDREEALAALSDTQLETDIPENLL